MKSLLGYRLIVDRHTTFMLRKPPSPRKTLFTYISNWTLRKADLTIVTNPFLAEIVRTRGGNPYILQDPLPDVTLDNDRRSAKCSPYGFFVCTYAEDEPYDEVIRAMDQLPDSCHLYISGRPPKRGFPPDIEAILARKPNIKITGFLPDVEYFALMRNCAFVVVLTRADHCLVCGAYEALSMQKPLVLSDRTALREYFGSVVPLYVGDDEESIRSGLRSAFNNDLPPYSDIAALRNELGQHWKLRFRRLLDLIGNWFATE